MPVLEALRSSATRPAAGAPGAAGSGVRVAKVFLSQRAGGAAVAEILAAAEAAAVVVERVREEMVAAVARNGRHHQGVAADLVAAGLEPLADFVERRHGRAHDTSLLVLDGVHNSANVGMIIRTAVAAGLDGVVVPQRGTAELGPLVIKASAGVALSAPLLRCATAAEGADLLVEARFHVVGLDATKADATSLFAAADLPGRAAYVLGNEAEGISPAVAAMVGRWVRIPLAGGVESLNVSSAATLVAFEVSKRRDRQPSRRSAASGHPGGAVSDAGTG